MCFLNLNVKGATESNSHCHQKSLDKWISGTYGTSGLNLQCPPEAHVLSTCSLAGGNIWKDYGTLRKPSLPGGRVQLGVAFEFIAQTPF